MCVGFSRCIANRSCERIRVGFVCEALIQFMPLIGWYRKLVANDIFVWRSFKQDSSTIKQNIQDFHQARERRMLFLSPEGVVVDFGKNDMEYIIACRKFCQENRYTVHFFFFISYTFNQKFLDQSLIHFFPESGLSSYEPFDYVLTPRYKVLMKYENRVETP